MQLKRFQPVQAGVLEVRALSGQVPACDVLVLPRPAAHSQALRTGLAVAQRCPLAVRHCRRSCHPWKMTILAARGLVQAG